MELKLQVGGGGGQVDKNKRLVELGKEKRVGERCLSESGTKSV